MAAVRTILGLVLAWALLTPSAARASEAAAWEALRNGGIALIRHANAPGVGDPPGLRVGDCATQRNLDAAGREQAQRIGEAFRARAIPVGAVRTSAWCRTVDTGALAFPGQGQIDAVFNSFFGERAASAPQTAAALAVMAAWTGPGALIVITHQVNITALTDVFPASGEAIVVTMRDGRPVVAGRLRF